MEHHRRFYVSLLILGADGLVIASFLHSRNYSLETVPLSDKQILAYFIGNYVRIEGMASSNLTINSDQTFSFTVHTDLLSDIRFMGTIKVAEEEIQLIPKEKTELFFITGHLVPIRWGKVKYLIAAVDITNFCRGVLNSTEPLSSGRSWYFHIFPDNSLPSSKSYPILPNGERLCQ